MNQTVKLSALDLATVVSGGNHRTAIERTVRTAQQLEALGYTRIWVAEHHNMEFIASSATSILIEHIASKTSSIRVGSGGIMLPNHSPLVIAEQFGTLATIHPNRIDLGLGRAPGTDQLTAMALRRNNMNGAYQFPQDIQDLQRYLSKENASAKVRAFPGEGVDVPLYILGSSTDSAYLAAELGLPYAFAAHFAPAQLAQAAKIYRQHFIPSTLYPEPYFICCVNVVAADTTAYAQLLSHSLKNLFASIVTNTRSPLSPPSLEPIYQGHRDIEAAVASMVSCTFIGDVPKIKSELTEFINELAIDELMATTYIYDEDERIHSYKLLKEALES